MLGPVRRLQPGVHEAGQQPRVVRRKLRRRQEMPCRILEATLQQLRLRKSLQRRQRFGIPRQHLSEAVDRGLRLLPLQQHEPELGHDVAGVLRTRAPAPP